MKSPLTGLGIMLLLPLILLGSVSGVSASSGASKQQQSCPQLSESIMNLQNSVNSAAANQLANSHLGTLNATFLNIVYNGKIIGCTPTLASVSVVYEVKGPTQQILEINENPTLTSIQSISQRNASWHQYPVAYQGTWSAYEIQFPGAPLIQSVLSWNVPSASEGYSHECDFKHCDMSVWPGLTDMPGGGTKGQSGYGIAQGGSDSGVYCMFGSCTQYLSSWIEFFPDPSMGCNWNPAVGDSMYANVFNPGGVPSSNYQVQVEDTTWGWYCSAQKSSMSMGWAYYAQFILEATSWCDCSGNNCTHHLPQFSQVTTFGGVYCYVGRCFNLAPQISGQSVTEYQMNNGQGNNTWNGPISGTTHGFPVRWLTSAGT